MCLFSKGNVKFIFELVTVMTVVVKSTIIPISEIILRSLDLCSGLLLSKHNHVVKDVLQYTVYETFFCTDSTTAMM